jgi:hypothetical protein
LCEDARFETDGKGLTVLDQPLPQFLDSLASLVLGFMRTWGGTLILTLVWVAWWLWGVNWKTAWATLAHGAWVPAVLVVVVSALVWSQIAPADCGCLGFVTIPNFWWQLGEVSMLASLALFCGWLQGYFELTPEAVEFEPAGHGHAPHGHGHHDHGHGHEHGGHHGHEHPPQEHGSHHGHGHDHGHHH